MTTVAVDHDTLRVSFTPTEHLLGVVRDLRVPLASVRRVEPLDTWRRRRGLRVGLSIPGRRLLGTWRGRGSRQLVALRRGQPALLVELDGERYDQLLLSCPDADRVLGQLTSRLG